MVESTPAPTPARGSEPANDSILEIVWRQRAIVGIAAFGCLLLASVYLLVATRYYSGYARLYVQQVGPQIMGEHQQATQAPDTFLFTQREVISSTPVVAMTLGAPGIRDLKTFSGEDNTFSFFKKSVSVEVGKKDELLTVTFDTPYRDEAQKIVAALVNAYIEYQSKQRYSSTSEVLSVLQQQRDTRASELRRKQDELQGYRAANGMISGADEKTNIAKQQLVSLLNALTQAQLETIAAKSAFTDVTRTVLADPVRKQKFEAIKDSSTVAPSMVDDAQLRTDMLQWQAHLQDLLSSGKYLPSHPRVLGAQTRIDQLSMMYASAVYRRMENAQQKEADLQQTFDQRQKLAIQQNARAVEDTRLAAEVDRLQRLSDELDNRVRTVSVTQASGAPSITVLEPPSASKKPTRPYVMPTLAVALIGGLMLGCGAACVRDWYDYRLRTADEIKASLGVTVLGLIPHVGDETSPIARGQKIHIDPGCDVAEAYRSLRTAIYFGTKEGPARSILVTSPERGDGKSTLASNLAISIAQASRRTLLIDADMRAPMQDLIFSMNGRIGLASVLQGKESINVAIRHTGIENLDLLPAGVAARNPSELLNSQRFIELLEELSDKYDHIVIDSPPLLAVTDARIVAASADATLLVLRAGKSNRKLSELSIDGLISVGAKLLGAVVNDVRRRNYSYYGSYGRYENGEYGGRPGHEAAANGNGRSEFAAAGESGLASRNL